MKYKKNKQKNSIYSNILNSISTILLFSCITIGAGLYFKDIYAAKVRVYDYIELKHNFKNCIIVGKTDLNDNYTLILHNPVLHKTSKFKNNMLHVDYKVRVYDYTYFHNFIGDTIK